MSGCLCFQGVQKPLLGDKTTLEKFSKNVKILRPQDRRRSCVTRQNMSNCQAGGIRTWFRAGALTSDFGEPGTSRELINSSKPAHPCFSECGPGVTSLQIPWGIYLNTGCQACPLASFGGSGVRPPRVHLLLPGWQSGFEACDPLS